MGTALTRLGKSAWRTDTRPVRSGCAGGFLKKRGLAGILAAMALLHAVLASRERVLWAAATLAYAGL